MDGIGLSNAVHFLRIFMRKRHLFTIVYMSLFMTVFLIACEKVVEEELPIIMVDSTESDLV